MRLPYRKQIVKHQKERTLRLIAKKNDHELIEMCRKDHDLGYSGLYQKYARKVYNSIHRLISHTAEAEDILQESFVEAFKEIRQSDRVLNFEAWVKRIAINKSISHLRKRKIQFSDAVLTEFSDEDGYDVGENEIFENKVADIRNCINELPSGYKTIICLYLFENIQHDEIANMLGISPTTVRTQYHRAKKKVILSLKDKVYHE